MINAVLRDKWQDECGEMVQKVRVLNPFSITDFSVDKRIVVDIRVTDERDRQFNIEFQTNPHTSFRERIAYSWANSFSSQLLIGQNYKALDIAVTIVISDFAVFPRIPNLHLLFQLRERDNPELLFTEHLQIHLWQFHELLRGNTTVLEGVTSEFAHWSQFFALGDKLSEAEMSTLTDGNPRIMEAHREFRKFTSDSQSREIARQRHIFLLDHHMAIDSSRVEGRVEGEEKGRVEFGRNAVLLALRKKFVKVPKRVEAAIRRMNDPMVLESLIGDVIVSRTLDEFIDTLN
jgi:predicted transposase/invertase (TIGR01784 family)